MRTHFATLALLIATTSCNDCDVTPVSHVTTDVVTDVFDQKIAAEVDILWMSDNSPTMQAEQQKLAARFREFFGGLVQSQVDYHIGVITQDADEGGVLHRYVGPAVPGCDGCRYLTNDVPCDDPAVSIEGLNEDEIAAKLVDACPAQLVFRNLIRTGLGGAVFEEGFVQAAQALGLNDVDPAAGVPRVDVPVENAGFVREDASLYVIFVSDEDESAKNDGVPVHYYERLFESLKGAGNENKVTVAAIAGWPTDNTVPPIGDVCGILGTTFDLTTSNDDARAPAVTEAMRAHDHCVDQDVAVPTDLDRAETGSRYIELACRTGGVVANMCEADYSAALEAMGADAAGLLRTFTLSHPLLEIEWGQDCVPGNGDDVPIDCDDDGSTNGALDGPLCVTATDLNADNAALVAEDAQGWQLDRNGAVHFGGAFLPKPGTHVRVTYRLHKGGCGG